MAEFDTDPTLTNILNQLKSIKKELENYISEENQRIIDISNMTSEIEQLQSDETDTNNINLLLKYKSTIFQIKSEIESEMNNVKIYLKKINNMISIVEKAMILSTGDIF